MSRLSVVASVILALPVPGADLTQSEWDSPGVTGPVREWGGGFSSSFGIDWQSEQGALSLDRLGSCMVMGSIGSGASDVVCGDVDGDGDTDIAALEYRGRIVWYENPGDGRSFVIHSVLPAPGEGHEQLVLVDADYDGDLDAVAASGGGSPPVLLVNGGSDLWSRTVLPEDSRGARALCAADMDGDGDPDLVAVKPQEGAVAWLENPADPAGAWTTHDVAGGIGSPWSVDAGDFDGDGDADVLVASPDLGEVLLFERDGGSWSMTQVAECADPLRAVLADLDGAGPLDVAVCSSSDDAVLGCVSAGGAWTADAVGSGLVGPEDLVASDLDGDGDTDIAAVSGPAGEVAWWQNLGGLRFAPRNAGTTPGVSCCDAGDIDGDGLPEVVTGSLDSGSIGWWEVLDRARSGSLTSSVLYIGPDPSSGTVEWDATAPSGTSARLYVRVSSSRLYMGDWTEVGPGGTDLDGLLAPGSAFLQYKVELTSSSPSLTPVVRQVRIRIDRPIAL